MEVRRRTAASLLVVTPSGFALKLYEGPGQNWVNNYAAGVLYVVFWCLVAFYVLPHRRYLNRIAICVFLVTSLLELLQLWNPWILKQVRASFLGQTLIGTTFAWWDFVHYALGSVLGWLWMSRTLTLVIKNDKGKNHPNGATNRGKL